MILCRLAARRGFYTDTVTVTGSHLEYGGEAPLGASDRQGDLHVPTGSG